MKIKETIENNPGLALRLCFAAGAVAVLALYAHQEATRDPNAPRPTETKQIVFPAPLM